MRSEDLRRRASRLRNPRYLAARGRGELARRLYRHRIEAIVSRPVRAPRAVGAAVFAFSCERDLPEQVASIRSFIAHVGVPQSFTVVSDGTYTPASRALLERVHPVVRVLELHDLLSGDLPGDVLRYGRSSHWQARKLSFQVALPVDGPTMYFDADVLFFEGAAELAGGELLAGGAPWYLPDCLSWEAPRADGAPIDTSLVEASERASPVNGGAYLLHHALDWDAALERFRRAGEPWSFYVDQILLHVAMGASSARPLPRDRFVMEIDDELSHRDRYAGPDIALRHYCYSVRYKLWHTLSTRPGDEMRGLVGV
jgi:hypothetical protein